MAYYNGFPVTYGYNPYYQQMNQQMMQQQAQAQQGQQQIQQSGFVLVRSEEEARNYPVAPGNSIYFKIENQPILYVKAMGFNQLEGPVFERYRMEKDDVPAAQNGSVQPASQQADKSTLYATKSELDALRGELDALKAKMNKKPKLTEESEDE